jgi:hypothetical protein
VEPEVETDIDFIKFNYATFENDILDSCNSELVQLNEFNVENNCNNFPLKGLHSENLLNGLHVYSCNSVHEDSLLEIVRNSNLNPNAKPFVPKNCNDSLYFNTSTCVNSLQDFDGPVPSPYVYSNMCLHQCDASVSVSSDFNVNCSNTSSCCLVLDFDGRGLVWIVMT